MKTQKIASLILRLCAKGKHARILKAGSSNRHVPGEWEFVCKLGGLVKESMDRSLTHGLWLQHVDVATRLRKHMVSNYRRERDTNELRRHREGGMEETYVTWWTWKRWMDGHLARSEKTGSHRLNGSPYQTRINHHQDIIVREHDMIFCCQMYNNHPTARYSPQSLTHAIRAVE